MTPRLTPSRHTAGRVQRSRRMGMPRALLPLAVTVAVCLLMRSPAAAHGVVEGSDPPANAALDSAPKQIVLKVTEPVDPVFSSPGPLQGRTAEIGRGHGRRGDSGARPLL